MDKLINYIQFREKKYGVIKGIASVNSMYYQIGVYMVRISEHMKYSESSIQGTMNFLSLLNLIYVRYGLVYRK